MPDYDLASLPRLAAEVVMPDLIGHLIIARGRSTCCPVRPFGAIPPSADADGPPVHAVTGDHASQQVTCRQAIQTH